MRSTKRLNDPVIAVPMRNQCPNADDRVVNVLGKLVAKLGTDFVVSFSVVTIRRSETYEVRNRLNIPYDHVGHVRRLAFTAA